MSSQLEENSPSAHKDSTEVEGKQEESIECETSEVKSVRTSDFYRTKNLPDRFERPDIVQGYNTKSEHPMYKTTGSLYGSQAPNVHTVPTEFHGRSQKFSKYYGRFGMYRNHSLNTSGDSNRV